MPGTLAALQVLDRDDVAARVPMCAAIAALQHALRSGLDPARALPRSIVDVSHGQLLLMPAEFGRFAGQKLATVAPHNPERGLERIQAVYVLLDAETLAPVALLDGTELTSIRTPAVSAAVIDVLAEPDATSLVVFGTGPQGIRHVEAMRCIRPTERVRFVGRDADRAAAAADAVREAGLDAAVGTSADVADADIIVCATTARTPLFDGALVPDRAAIVAIGSHETDARELPGDLVGRAQVVVETDAVARAEAGDVVMAAAEGLADLDAVVPMADVLTGRVEVDRSRPRVFKTCGMGWQDLVVAQAAVEPERV